ncbi:MAG: hypothetical protein FWC98_04180 [Bacteroidales bacterium]|nr:hypothetical protein [Bacteroidales bacterium]
METIGKTNDLGIFFDLRNELTGIFFNGWCFDEVIDPKTIKDKTFYKLLKSEYYPKQRVPVTQIKGTTHPNYSNRNWLQMLAGLQRNRNADRESALRLILDDSKDKITLIKKGNDYYIDSGNHRCCFAKFLDVEYVDCEVIEKFFDNEAYELHNRLASVGYSVEIVSRDSWILRIMNLTINIKTIENVHAFINAYDSVKLSVIDKKLLKRKALRYLSSGIFLFFHDRPIEKKVLKMCKLYLQGQEKF